MWSDHRNPTAVSHVQHKELTQNRGMYPNLRPKKCGIYIYMYEKAPILRNWGGANFATTPHHFHLVHNDEIPVDELCLRMSLHQPSFATQKQVPGFQGCNVIRQGSKALQGSRIPQLQVSRIARLQISRVTRFQRSGLPGFWGSKFPGFKVPSIRAPDL